MKIKISKITSLRHNKNLKFFKDFHNVEAIPTTLDASISRRSKKFKISKATRFKTIILISFLLIAKNVFSVTNINTNLGINTPPVSIVYNPAYITGNFTSGNVFAQIIGTGVRYNNFIISNNGNYSFDYYRGTGPFTTGAGYGPTNTRSLLSIIGAVTWIDKEPPAYSGFTNGANYKGSVTITFYDNNSGVTATLNNSPFIFGSSVSANGTYTLIITDVAGNKVTATFTIGGGGGGGGGGGETPQIDICANRNCNSSYYNILCGPCPVETGIIISGHEQIFEIPKQEPIITPENTKEYSEEMLDAYKYAYSLGITTMDSVTKAQLDGPLLRKHLAKMISEYATKVIGIKLNDSKKCDYPDINQESEEMKYYMRLSCKLGLMGLNADGITVRDTFMPNELVNRAQFGTVFSRLIFGMEYNLKGGELTLFQRSINALQNSTQQLASFFGIRYVANIQVDWYTKHLNALKDNNIITNINPIMTEIRGYVMTMMMRADKNGIIQMHYGASIPTNITK